jgi:hemoglobin
VNDLSLYQRVGGLAFFERLAGAFYEGIATDEVLLPLYPDPADLGPASRRLALFLAQYWGGPDTYSQERGHPRLRMRHAPYLIGPLQRDRWLVHMAAAVERSEADPEVQAELMTYFVRAAEHLRNDEALPLVEPT